MVICADGEPWKSVGETVRRCGLCATCCCGLHEALSLLARQRFSVVFCSDILPDGDFRAGMKEVRRLSPNLPVIVLSHLADWDAYLSGLGTGAFDYVAFPPDSAETERILWAGPKTSAQAGKVPHLLAISLLLAVMTAD